MTTNPTLEMNPKKKPDIAGWVAEALVHAGMSQAELARQLAARLGEGYDRSKVQKTVGGKRALSADELLAIEDITRYPAPADAHVSGNTTPARDDSLKLHPTLVETFLPDQNYRPGPTITYKQSAVPIRGRAMAGKDGTLQFGSDDIVGWADAPEKLASLPGTYAVYVVGDSMEPVLYEGFICHVNPNLPPARGLAVIQVSTDDGVTVVGYVKRLISVTDKFVKVCQYNPKEERTFPRKHVVDIHRIVLSGPPY